EARHHHTAYPVQGPGLRPDQGRRWTAHALPQRLPAAVLHADHRRDGRGKAARGRRDDHAGRQRRDGHYPRRADWYRARAPVRHPRRWQDRRRRRGDRGHQVTTDRKGKGKGKAVAQKIRIRLKAYDHRVLDQAADKIVDTARRTNARTAGPIPLPTEISKLTVIRSPFIDKDSREQFEMRTHKRIVDIL